MQRTQQYVAGSSAICLSLLFAVCDIRADTCQVQSLQGSNCLDTPC